MPRFTCPSCEEDIDYVDVTEHTRNYGTAQLMVEPDETVEVDYTEVNDSETEDCDYYCPECNTDLDLGSIIVDLEDEQLSRPQPRQSRPFAPSRRARPNEPVIRDNADEGMLESPSDRSAAMSRVALSRFVRCPNCRTALSTDTFQQAPDWICNCGTTVTLSNSLALTAK